MVIIPDQIPLTSCYPSNCQERFAVCNGRGISLVEDLPSGFADTEDLLRAINVRERLLYLPSSLHSLVDFLEEIPLPAAFGIPDGGGIGGLGDQQVRAAFINPGSSERRIQTKNQTSKCFLPLGILWQLCLN